MGDGFIVVKLGGRLAVNESIVDSIAGDVGKLKGEGWRLILVHGGGDAVTEYSRKLGLEPRFVVSPSGVRSRYTSLDELRVYAMVMGGLLNKLITARLNSRGVSAIGVSGVDCRILQASRKERIVIVNERGRPQVIPGGYTGSIERVNTACLEAFSSMVDAVVLAPLAVAEDGTMLNVDADQAAAAIAGSLKAHALVFLTDVPGVLLDGVVVGEIPRGEAETVAVRVGHGMKRKIMMAAKAVDGGARLAVIASGLVATPITSALQGSGTVVR